MFNQTQDEVSDGEHITLSITFAGDCDGNIHVEAIEEMKRSPTEGEPGEIPSGPITGAQTDDDTLELLVPKGASVRLGTFCDGDEDGLVTPGENGDTMGEQKVLGVVDADESLTLNLSGNGVMAQPPGQEGLPPEDAPPEDGTRPDEGPPEGGNPEGPATPDENGPPPEGEGPAAEPGGDAPPPPEEGAGEAPPPPPDGNGAPPPPPADGEGGP